MTFREALATRMIPLWHRGYVTKVELHTLLAEAGIDRRYWRAVELEWRASNRMLSWFRYPDEATAARECPAGPLAAGHDVP